MIELNQDTLITMIIDPIGEITAMTGINPGTEIAGIGTMIIIDHDTIGMTGTIADGIATITDIGTEACLIF